MGGTISVDSHPGVGSKFTVKLPASLVKENPDNLNNREDSLKRVALDKNIRGRKILLVEDDIINASFIKSLISSYGSVDTVTGGHEAVQKAKELKYDLILMDIGLRGTMDGIQATKIIKKESKNINTTVIALTAHAMLGDRERILGAGLDDYLSKPFSKVSFFKTINKYLSD
jgi:CheY-like chemotaxis protein